MLCILATDGMGDLFTAISRKSAVVTWFGKLTRKMFDILERKVEQRKLRDGKGKARGKNRQRKISRSLCKMSTPANDKVLLDELRRCILDMFSDQSSEMR